MKLIDLLKEGKKAKHEFFLDHDYEEYVYVADNESPITVVFKEGLEEFRNFSIEELLDEDWDEYIEEPQYKTNFKTNGNPYFFIASDGEIVVIFRENIFEEEKLENFNVFPNKELAEYIQAKQLLERKLMIFSYLNGADEIDWKNTNEKKYYIECYYNYYKDKLENATDYTCDFMDDELVYFKTEEVAEKALELYENEIEKVMKMRKEFGF